MTYKLPLQNKTKFFLFFLFLFTFIGISFLANTVAAADIQLLPAPWNLTSTNGSSEKYQTISQNSLLGKDTLRLTYNLHGLCAFGGDASAIIFDQPKGGAWRYISLSRYGKNCLDGLQTVDIPLSDFPGLNVTLPVGTFHARFWANKAFTVDITNATLITKQTQTPITPTPTQPVVTPLPTATPTQAPVSTTGYTGQYFNNTTLSGTPKLTRTDAQINFTWNASSPDTLIPADLFSARWTRTAFFNGGTYMFSVTADDGVRLFVDGIKIIDQWRDQGATTYTANVTLANGNHTLVIEYYEKYGGAVAKFSFAQIATPTPTNVPQPTPTTPVQTGQSWAIQSVSSMKETKDKICGQRDAAWIAKWVAKAKELGANYIAVETPYENPACGNALTYTNTWISAIRGAGLKVWHRHMPLAFESIYDVAKTNNTDFLPTISNYIKNNPNMYQAGDIFTPIPEPQNGGIQGITYCAFGVCQYANAAAFNSWLRNAIDTSESAFASIGLGGKMKIGYYGFDGFVAWGANNPDWNGILEDATIAKMGNITIDHYPQLINTSMTPDLDELQARYPNTPIIIGEWGTVGTTNLEQQVLENMSALKRKNIVGVNYWHMGMGGNEALINDDFSNRIQYDEVQSYFKGLR